MERTFGPYPGLAILGGGGLCGFYGPAGGPPGAQGIGLQHLFYGDYRQDLVHTATTLVRLPGERVEWGNRTYDYRRHPDHVQPKRVFNRDGYAFGSTFASRHSPGLERTEVVHCAGDGHLTFVCTLTNATHTPVDLEVYAMVVFRADAAAETAVDSGGVCRWQGRASRKHLAVSAVGTNLGGLVADSPSGFLYRTVQAIVDGTMVKELTTAQPVGLLLGRSVTVPAHGSYTFIWHLGAGDTTAEAVSRASEPGDGARYWEAWYQSGAAVPLQDPAFAQYYRANLAVLRAAVMPDGFVPADMTGQYFAGGSPSYYARDALMVARALMLAGHAPEFSAVLRYLAGRSFKGLGEFCQRYDAAGDPAEGQNNGVPHQLDSQGYFARLVYGHWRRTGKLLVPFTEFARRLDTLLNCVGPQGMVGPEGGVNEGVFGPAYITSTNMFVHGGLAGGIALARALGETAAADRWRALQGSIATGIAAAWDETAGRYGYGFTAYAAEPVRKYDTPQYFGPLYGYKIDDRFRCNDKSLRRDARFLGAGVGYSEQEYHHGPWTFNTAACAEYQALTGKWAEYRRIMKWLLAHTNQFGLMPEAFSADVPNQCHVNPLVWGCAEAVSAIAILATADGEVPGYLAGAGQFLGGTKEVR